MRRAVVISIFAMAQMVWAQEKNNPPVVVRRAPPPLDRDSAVLQKKVQSDLEGLEQQNPKDAKPSPAANTPTTAADRVPSDFKGPQDIPLSPTAAAAVRVSEKWLTDTVTPAPGPDGRVLYTYGAGLATVVCAPLRVCTIELQKGERLVDEPHIGDSVRWYVSPALYGRDNSSTTVVVVKPQEPGLDTNLLIPTDRRIYYLRLVSKPEDYTARVAFAYPDDDQAEQRWHEHLAKQEQERKEASRIAELGPNASESMNFNYEVKGDAAIRPLMVFDDGAKTFIRMNPAVKHKETPILVVIGSDGKAEMVNYRVKNELYIADRLFDRARLAVGNRKNSLKVEIRRGRPGD